MSIFADFQRMWMKRFPDNALSSEWENDVRFSLQQHKQKVVDMTKELEQEMLYVEYLERLLGDVETFRQCGGDPTIPIVGDKDAASQAAADAQADGRPNDMDDLMAAEVHASPSTNGVCMMMTERELQLECLRFDTNRNANNLDGAFLTYGKY